MKQPLIFLSLKAGINVDDEHIRELFPGVSK